MRLGLGLGLFKAGAISAGVRIFSAFQTRVIGDGGTVEAGTCVVNGVNNSSILQRASLLLIPSGYKGGKLYSEIPTNGNGDLTWTRGGDAFRTNASGVLQRVPWNLFQYSEDLSNASNWFTISATITTNTTTAPNGTLTADKLTATATTSTHILLQQPAGSVSGATSTVSIYAKSAGLSNIQFLNNAGGLGVANFNLSAGTAVLVNGVSASIENVGNGWYRCIMTYTPTTSGNYNVQIRLADSSGNTTFLGNGTDGVFLWGAQLVEGTTAQTYLPTTDRLNFPRLSYMYGSCPSVLLEPQRTNVALWSQDFDNSAWQKSNVTVTANTTISPDGSTNADTISITSNNGYIRLFPLTFANSTTYTCSVFVKNNGISAGQTFIFYATNNLINPNALSVSAIIDINNGSVTPSSSGSGVSAVSANISSLINGWYRVQLTFTVGASAGGSICEIGFSAPTATRTFFAWGAQLEAGAYPTTYIQTTSATATRVADSFSRDNIYTNGLISASGGTWFVEFRNNIVYTRDNASSAIFINTGTSPSLNDGFRIRNGGGPQRFGIDKIVASVPSSLYATTTDTVKLVIKWNGTSADIFANGTKVVSATAFTTTAMEYLNGTPQVPTFIQQMALFPTPLSDTDCAAITSL